MGIVLGRRAGSKEGKTCSQTGACIKGQTRWQKGPREYCELFQEGLGNLHVQLLATFTSV
jgi:hypothetical protein